MYPFFSHIYSRPKAQRLKFKWERNAILQTSCAYRLQHKNPPLWAMLSIVEYGIATTAVSMVGRMFIAGTYISIHLYTSELFPTEIRNGGLGISNVVSTISGMVAPFAVDPLVGCIKSSHTHAGLA